MKNLIRSKVREPFEFPHQARYNLFIQGQILGFQRDYPDEWQIIWSEAIAQLKKENRWFANELREKPDSVETRKGVRDIVHNQAVTIAKARLNLPDLKAWKPGYQDEKQPD